MEEINAIELMYIVCCLTDSEVIVRSEQHAIVDMMNVMFWCILVHAPMTTVFMSFLLEVSGGTVTHFGHQILSSGANPGTNIKDSLQEYTVLIGHTVLVRN